MRQRSSVEPSKSPQPKVLHPVLRATLESLDVQLDEELSRYRRLQSHQRLKQAGRVKQRPQPNALAVGAVSGTSQLRASETLPQTAGTVAPPTKPPSKPEALHAQPLSALAIAPDVTPVTPGELTSTTPPAASADLRLQPEQSLAKPDELAPDNYLESSEELLKSIAEEEALRAEREPRLLESLLTPLGIGSMLLLLLSSVTFGYLVMNPSSLNALSGQRVANGNNAASTEPSSNMVPNSPGGSAATTPEELAGPDLSSQEFQPLNLDTLSSIPNNGGRPTAASSTTASTATATNPTGNATLTPNSATPTVVVPQQVPAAAQPAPASPERATSQNAPVRQSASRRATSQRTAAAQPAPRRASSSRASSNRSATPERRSAARTQPAPTRQPQPRQTEAPRSAANSSTTRSAPVAPPPAQSQGDRYYVVTPYNSDRSLTQARQAVGDAYVRNFPAGGAQVQMGVFSERQRAQQLMQDLERQGISAEIYEP
jgi:hypothetical protein